MYIENRTLRESLLLFCTFLPFIVLRLLWEELPQEAPIHRTITGAIDRMGDKSNLLFIPILLPMLTYVIFYIVESINPKKYRFDTRFQNRRLVTIMLLSVIGCMIILSSK